MKHINRRYIISLFLILLHSPLGSCSIVGYIGDNVCKNFIQLGLERLEYRGYDSAGFACLDEQKELLVIKAEGKLEKLKEALKADTRDSHIGIGHTRWATHGPATHINAHPHTDDTRTVAVVHNGIIENYFELKELLIQEGHTFISDTDTEVIPHLWANALKKKGNTLIQAAIDVAHKIKGTFALITLLKNEPDTLVVMRKTAPLVVGIGEQETFIASDFLAFAGKTNKVLFIPDASFAIIKKDCISLYSFDGTLLSAELQTLDVPAAAYQKFEHEHFMIKEIYEQPKAIRAAIAYYKSLGSNIWTQLGISSDYARTLRSIHLFGCGTSWHAARIAQFFFEMIAGVPAATHLASEFRYMPFFPQNHALFVAISQSGETADTLESLRLIKSYDHPVITITNVPTSTLARESVGFLPLKAGPEIAVASTKAFTTQVVALYWLAHCLAIEKGVLPEDALEQAEKNLLEAADALEQTLEKYRMDIITVYAKKYAQAKRFMYLGRHISYPFAMEGALKLKEISYIFAQGYPAGELKHGSIALVDNETPSIMFSHQDPLIYSKLLANAQEIKARKGHLIAFAFEGQHELLKLADQSFIIAKVAPLLEPIAMAGLMQFFAYQIAKELGRDIDQPRNLAKAVTVE